MADSDRTHDDTRGSRREFIARAATFAAALCTPRRLLADSKFRIGGDGRLKARPRAPTITTGPGQYALERDDPRDGQLYLPSTYSAKTPAPLVIALHGAGGSGRSSIRVMRALADDYGVAILAPDSRGGTWDAIRGSLGDDVDFIDGALDDVFKRVNVDPTRVSVAGFSDGATYALTLGLINGDLFSHVLAFSPGFVVRAKSVGRPPIFISHGRQDPILPFDRCGARIAADLTKEKYNVRFVPFDGGHAVPPDILRQAGDWLKGQT